MMNALTALRREQRGVALTEFAIILPVLLVLVFGIWEVGRVLDAWLVVTNAAREGARYAVEIKGENDEKTREDITKKINAYISSGYGARIELAGDIDNYTIAIDRPHNTGPITVTVTANVDIYGPIEPLLPALNADGTFTVSGRAVMRQ